MPEALLIALVVLALGWLVLVAVVWLNRPTRAQAAVYLRLLPELTRLVFRLVRDPGTPTRYRIGLVPFLSDQVAVDLALFQPDGIHPNAQAQPILLNNLWPQLSPLLQRNR